MALKVFKLPGGEGGLRKAVPDAAG